MYYECGQNQLAGLFLFKSWTVKYVLAFFISILKFCTPKKIMQCIMIYLDHCILCIEDFLGYINLEYTFTKLSLTDTRPQIYGILWGLTSLLSNKIC